MNSAGLSVALMYAFEHGREGVIWDDPARVHGQHRGGLAEPVSNREGGAGHRPHEVVTRWQTASTSVYEVRPFVDPKACSYPGPPSAVAEISNQVRWQIPWAGEYP